MSKKLAIAAGFIMFSSLAVADNSIVTDLTSTSNVTSTRVIETTVWSLIIPATPTVLCIGGLK